MGDVKLNVGYPLYDIPYSSELPLEQYYIVRFDKMPSKFGSNNIFYDITITDYIKNELNFTEDVRILNTNRRNEKSFSSLYISNDKQMMIKLSNGAVSSQLELMQIEYLFSLTNGELETQINLEKIEEFKRNKKRANIQLVKSEMGHLDTEDYDLEVQEMNLELNYGTDFIKVHEVIVNKLNVNRGKGIILLHGDPGTGKTSYIKYLTSLIPDKDILFIPPSMAEMLSEPSIIPFLMEHKNSILIIEDAERVIADREGKGSPAGVSNILNLTDGILGDCLNIQILATFNMKREKIDQALLRKGRLIAEHKFEKLNVEESNKLLKYLNKEYTVSEETSLADLYNIDVEVFKTSNKSKIGLH
jgi:energy-coupling factor transporter ATP-binding protein EcfA2